MYVRIQHEFLFMIFRWGHGKLVTFDSYSRCSTLLLPKETLSGGFITLQDGEFGCWKLAGSCRVVGVRGAQATHIAAREMAVQI